MKNKIITVIGWTGAIIIILAYASVSFGYLSPLNFWYQILNIVGSIGILIEAFHKKDYPPGVLNIIWVIIALVAIIKIV